MTLPHIEDGDEVTAHGWWNPLTDDVNTNTAALAAVTSRLGRDSHSGGLSDMPGRLDTDDATAASQGASVGDLKTAVGLPYANATTVAQRAHTTELIRHVGAAPAMILTRENSQQALSSSTDTLLTFDTTVYSHPDFSNTPNGSSVIAPYDGMYRLAAGYRIYTSGERDVSLVEGTTSSPCHACYSTIVGSTVSCSVTVKLTAGDKVSGLAWAANGGNIGNVDGRPMYLSVMWLGQLG